MAQRNPDPLGWRAVPQSWLCVSNAPASLSLATWVPLRGLPLSQRPPKDKLPGAGHTWPWGPPRSSALPTPRMKAFTAEASPPHGQVPGPEDSFQRKLLWLSPSTMESWCFGGDFLSHQAACGILVLRPGIKPRPPAVEVQSANYLTHRAFPDIL